MLSNRSFKFDNNHLKHSLKQDLKRLDDLNHSTSLNQPAMSWLHPNQPIVYNPEHIYNLKMESDEDYMDCLELIIDRIYSILGSCLYLLDDTSSKNIHKSVVKPEKMTLSLIVTNVYEQIKNLINFKNNSKLDETTKLIAPNPKELSNKSDKETQINTNIVQCSSCSISLKCIKLIADQLSKLGENRSVSIAKDKMKSLIFTSTQEESVDLLTNAINKDVRDLTYRNSELEANLGGLKNQLENLDLALQESLNKIRELEENINKLEEFKLKEQQQHLILNNIINKLLKNKKRAQDEMEWHKVEYKQLESVVESQTANIKELQEELENFRMNNKRLLSQEELLKSEKALWKARFARAEETNDNITTQNKELRINVQRIADSIDSIENTCKGIEENVSESWVLVEDNMNSFQSFFNCVEDVVNSSTILEENLNNSMQIVNSKNISGDMEVKGDPFLDMMKQIKDNNENIEKMQRQNEVLLKIVKKFEEHSKTSN
nr:uncharacterized protein PFB0145c-like [Onthophagus taurus]